MLQFSDSDSDSDKGIRYKTDSTRNKTKNDSNTSRNMDHRDSRDRKPERYRRHSSKGEDRYKRRRSRSSSIDKHYKHKSNSEKRLNTRDRYPDCIKDGMKSKLAVSEKVKYDKTTIRHRERSPSKRKVDESHKNACSGSRKLGIDTKIKSANEGIQKSITKTTKNDCNEVNEMNKETGIEFEDMFGPSLPPHLQKEKKISKEYREEHDGAGSCTSSPKETKSTLTENDEHSERLSETPLIAPDLANNSKKDTFIKEPLSKSPHSADKLEEKGLLQSISTCNQIFEKKNVLEKNSEKLDDALIGSVVNPSIQFGPTLPPQSIENDSSYPSVSKADSCSNTASIIGPELPQHLQKKEHIQYEKIPCIEQDQGIANNQVVGPTLPPHLQQNCMLEQNERDNSDIVGPALPPHLLKKGSEQSKIIGPALPSHLRQQLEASQVDNDEDQVESEDDTYGPLPPGMSVGRSHIELEERALQLKIDQLGPKDDQEPKREEWMLELPEAKAASFGLGPRQFRAREGPDMSDRSSWTTTPKDAAKKDTETKVDLKQEAKIRHMKEKDEQQEKIAKSSKRNKKSLLEIHQKKLMKEKKSDEPAERRPFSRDIDLQVRRLDEVQKKAVLKSAQLLDDKFSSGQARYL